MTKLFSAVAGLSLVLLISIDAASLSGLVGGTPFARNAERNNMPPGWSEKAVTHSAPFENDDLVVALDHMAYRILSPVIAEYAKKKSVKISVIDGTCGNSIGLLYRKQVDIGGLCCPPEASDRMPGLRFQTLGITPVAAIVHKDNPIDEMTLRQLRKIYVGEIHKWEEMGNSKSEGMGDHIVPVARMHCKERPGHWRLLLDSEELFTADIVEVGTIPDMISVVASSPDAIGLESLWLATDYYKDRWKVKALSINGMDPGHLEHLMLGEYPLYRVMSITIWEKDITEKSLAYELVMHMTQYIEREGRRFDIVSSADLRRAGWKFQGQELIGEPK